MPRRLTTIASAICLGTGFAGPACPSRGDPARTAPASTSASTSASVSPHVPPPTRFLRPDVQPTSEAARLAYTIGVELAADGPAPAYQPDLLALGRGLVDALHPAEPQAAPSTALDLIHRSLAAAVRAGGRPESNRMTGTSATRSDANTRADAPLAIHTFRISWSPTAAAARGRHSYALGHLLAEPLRGTGLTLHLDALLAGYADAQSAPEPRIGHAALRHGRDALSAALDAAWDADARRLRLAEQACPAMQPISGQAARRLGYRELGGGVRMRPGPTRWALPPGSGPLTAWVLRPGGLPRPDDVVTVRYALRAADGRVICQPTTQTLPLPALPEGMGAVVERLPVGYRADAVLPAPSAHPPSPPIAESDRQPGDRRTAPLARARRLADIELLAIHRAHF